MSATLKSIMQLTLKRAKLRLYKKHEFLHDQGRAQVCFAAADQITSATMGTQMQDPVQDPLHICNNKDLSLLQKCGSPSCWQVSRLCDPFSGHPKMAACMALPAQPDQSLTRITIPSSGMHPDSSHTNSIGAMRSAQLSKIANIINTHTTEHTPNLHLWNCPLSQP